MVGCTLPRNPWEMKTSAQGEHLSSNSTKMHLCCKFLHIDNIIWTISKWFFKISTRSGQVNLPPPIFHICQNLRISEGDLFSDSRWQSVLIPLNTFPSSMGGCETDRADKTYEWGSGSLPFTSDWYSSRCQRSHSICKQLSVENSDLENQISMINNWLVDLGQERPMSRPVKQNVDAKERFSHCQRSHAEMKTCNISKSHISGAIFNAEMKICSIS